MTRATTNRSAASSRADTPSAGGPGRVGRWCHAHRRLVVGAWAVAFAVAITAWVSVGTRFSNDFSGNGTEAEQAQSLLAEQFPAQAGSTAEWSSGSPAT